MIINERYKQDDKRTAPCDLTHGVDQPNVFIAARLTIEFPFHFEFKDRNR